MLEHSRPQRPQSFWSAPRIETSGRSRFFWACTEYLLWIFRQSDLPDLTMSRWFTDFWSWRRPEISILGADRKDCGLWGREWVLEVCISTKTNWCCFQLFYGFKPHKGKSTRLELEVQLVKKLTLCCCYMPLILFCWRSHRDLSKNAITVLPERVFDALTQVLSLYVKRSVTSQNTVIQVILT